MKSPYHGRYFGIRLAKAGEPVERAGLNAWLTEARELLKLAGPLVITQLAQMAILTTDIVMLGRYSEAALAGGAWATRHSFSPG